MNHPPAFPSDSPPEQMALRQWARRREILTIMLLLSSGIGYLIIFYGVPLLRALIGSVGLYSPTRTASGFTLQWFAVIFQNKAYRASFLFSLWLALGPVLLALIISVPLAAFLQKTFIGKKTFEALYKIPLAVPGIVVAFIVMTSIDKGGVLHRVFKYYLDPLFPDQLAWLKIGANWPKFVRDPIGLGVILASSWKNIPFMTLIIGGAMAAIAHDVLDAARTLGAKRLTVFFQIQIPLALPGISAAILLSFIRSIGAYAVPRLLGPPEYPLPLSIRMFEFATEQNEWEIVFAMGILLSFAASVVLLVYYGLTAHLNRAFHAGRRN
jgi:putative spermidine/putrescine transport system permease protein